METPAAAPNKRGRYTPYKVAVKYKQVVDGAIVDTGRAGERLREIIQTAIEIVIDSPDQEAVKAAGAILRAANEAQDISRQVQQALGGIEFAAGADGTEREGP